MSHRDTINLIGEFLFDGGETRPKIEAIIFRDKDWLAISGLIEREFPEAHARLKELGINYLSVDFKERKRDA